MKKIINHIRTRFNTVEPEQINWPPVDVSEQIERIRRRESEDEIGLGRRIHTFDYHEFELRLDREVMGFYRVTAYEGEHRQYSFTILCAQHDYAALHTAFDQILAYIAGDRRLADLPKNDLVQGHFYGYGE